MKSSNSVVLALSGGIDSSTTAYWLKEQGYEVNALYFSNYSKADQPQSIAVKKICSQLSLPLTTVDFSFYKSLPNETKRTDTAPSDTNPNALFFQLSTLCLVAARTLSPYVSMGLTAEDAQEQPHIAASFHNIVNGINATLHPPGQRNTIAIKALFPFLNRNKTQVVSAALDLNLCIENTYSCAVGHISHCGRCTCCQQRNQALDAAQKFAAFST